MYLEYQVFVVGTVFPVGILDNYIFKGKLFAGSLVNLRRTVQVFLVGTGFLVIGEGTLGSGENLG